MSSTLPPEEERYALLEALAALCEKRGFAPFLNAPILLANEGCFLDPWFPDLEGARLMALRLLGYAGLGHLRVEMEGFANEETVEFSANVGRIELETRKHGAAAWFEGIHEDTCHFGVDVSGLHQPEQLVGVLAHEVAHAYRAYHGLVEQDGKLEEQLTDLTTVFLGFGVLTTNATDRYRSSGEFIFSEHILRWQREQVGYLSPAVMGFLLATQVWARNVDGERRNIKGQLERNQAASFAAALSWLDAHRDEIRSILKLWYKNSKVDVQTAKPAPAMERRVPAEQSEPQQQRHPNAGMPVFRFRSSGIELMGPMLFIMLLAMPMVILSTSMVPILLAPVLVIVLEKYVLRPMCSGCEHRVANEARECPSCGGIIAGNIRRKRERLAAEERYWASRGGPPDHFTQASDVEPAATPASHS